MAQDNLFQAVLKTDTDASGDGSDSTTVTGFIESIYLDYAAGTAATADVTFTDQRGNAILTVTDNNTDAVIPLRIQAKDTTGAAITGQYERVPLLGALTMTIAQGGASVTDAVTAYVLVASR